MHHRRFNKLTHVADPDEPESGPEPGPASEAGPASPSSGEDNKTEAPSPKKRREMKKRVVTIPIGDVDGSKSKGENYPPSDSWAWRKYGQKPIKGSPYPRIGSARGNFRRRRRCRRRKNRLEAAVLKCASGLWW